MVTDKMYVKGKSHPPSKHQSLSLHVFNNFEAMQSDADKREDFLPGCFNDTDKTPIRLKAVTERHCKS